MLIFQMKMSQNAATRMIDKFVWMPLLPRMGGIGKRTLVSTMRQIQKQTLPFLEPVVVRLLMNTSCRNTSFHAFLASIWPQGFPELCKRKMGNTSCCRSCSPSQEDYQTVFSKMVVVEEMSHIDELISYIDQLLNAIDDERQVPKMDQVGSSINTGGGLLEKALKRSNSHICKRDIMPKLNRETRKPVIDVTNQAAQIAGYLL
ncbi:uncharacterized protein LOC131050726 isoform X1 [Cryptomeria japonica]|uniref:uncharacterized protein LOC131050726 isoform X1 n=1 Tax=Cryptomeria japonica TaxID=3369 RepID=UPI0025AC491B|nr:uncharacterized protein LOC131050726 isoform X1 [Cryptomeria japonica]